MKVVELHQPQRRKVDICICFFSYGYMCTKLFCWVYIQNGPVSPALILNPFNPFQIYNKGYHCEPDKRFQGYHCESDIINMYNQSLLVKARGKVWRRGKPGYIQVPQFPCTQTHPEIYQSTGCLNKMSLRHDIQVPCGILKYIPHDVIIIDIIIVATCRVFQ